MNTSSGHVPSASPAISGSGATAPGVGVTGPMKVERMNMFEAGSDHYLVGGEWVEAIRMDGGNSILCCKCCGRLAYLEGECPHIETLRTSMQGE